jgi:hypothetical protein
MRALVPWAGFAIAIWVSADAQTPPPLLARPSLAPLTFTSRERWNVAWESYKKQLYDRINAQWRATVKAHDDAKLRVGTVLVHFTLTDAGKVRDLYFLPTDASGRLKRLTADAINHTNIAPPPLLEGQKEVDLDLTFRLLQH